MEDVKVAHRYAKSFIQLTLEQGLLEKAYADMGLVSKTCKECHDFSVMLKSPVIKTDKKEAILHEVFDGKINPLTLSFIKIIVRKKREMYLESIANAFIAQYKESKKILTAVITTAFGLDDDLRKKVLEIVKKSTNSDIILEEKVDSNIIGGYILRVGDNQDDTSIARKIKNLNRTFNENPYIKEF